MSYWKNKIGAWLNETVIKAFCVSEHKDIAKDIAEKLGFYIEENTESYRKASLIASSMVHSALPRKTSDKSGAVNFSELTHPLVEYNAKLDFSNVDSKKLSKDVLKLLQEDLKKFDSVKDEKEKNRQIFNYLFFAFQKRLRTKNIGNLGGAWDILPEDTRMPDTPIWHHLGMTSALYSSGEKPSMVVYSITPVQEFIGRARKLRDYWSGSVLLSYLAFAGIMKVCEELGPDHILYPSLHNQFLIDAWLKKNDLFEEFLKDSEYGELEKKSASIAAFPNKFVFVCDHSKVQEICEKIEEFIKEEWKAKGDIVKKYISDRTNSNITALWDSQFENYWNFSWASSDFVSASQENVLEKVLAESKYKRELNAINAFSENYDGADKENCKKLYGTSHSLVQGVLAAGKNKPTNIRKTQKGEKCPLCGENEVLSNIVYDGKMSANEYSKGIKNFWDSLRNKVNGSDENSYSQVGKNERLCAICATKRFLPVAIRPYKDEILCETLKDNDFPSTSEMALRMKLEKQDFSEKERKAIINLLHNDEIDSDVDEETARNSKEYDKFVESNRLRKLLRDRKIGTSDIDKYYAVLLMDGDKMGDLVNGETIQATWQDVLSQDFKKKIESDKNLKTVFNDKKNEKWLNDNEQNIRTMNPALHSMISDSLNNFARYGVQPVIEKHHGRLIYAGGDDVCAVLPLSEAIDAADEIRKAYTSHFSILDAKDSELIFCEKGGKLETNKGKIVTCLGTGKKISISGAVIITHQKAPLREIMKTAHSVLDGVAKERSGRNSIAIRQSKRSGGDRDWFCKWNEEGSFTKRPLIEVFKKVEEFAKDGDLSTSLLYRLSEKEMKKTFETVVLSNQDEELKKSQLLDLLKYEVSHSSKTKAEKLDELTENLADIIFRFADSSKISDKKINDKTDKEESYEWYVPEGAIIANWLSGVNVSEESN